MAQVIFNKGRDKEIAMIITVLHTNGGGLPRFFAGRSENICAQVLGEKLVIRALVN